MSPPNLRDRVTLIITTTVCIFMLLSLVGAYALAWTDRDPGEIWSKVFDLVMVLAGAVVGYVAGERAARPPLLEPPLEPLPEDDLEG